MGVPINNVPRRVVFAASGVGPYAFTFEILAAGDIAVFRDDTLLTITTDYTVSINPDGTGSVTLVADPTGATQIAIVGNRTIQRISDFVTGGDFFANTLNDELDQQTIFAQQNAEGLARSLQAPITDPTNVDMTLPRAGDRAGKYLAFDENGNPRPGDTAVEVAAVFVIRDEIQAVAAIDDEVVAVAGNATNVNTVAGISANVTTVAGIAPNVTTVAGNTSNINTVAGNNANVTTVAGSISNVNAVGTNISNVNAVAGNATNINAVNANKINIDTVAGIDADVSTVAGISAAVSTVATNDANVTAVAGNATNINAVAGNNANITAVAGNATNINAVNANATNINTVAGISTNVTTVAGISSDVTAVAGVAADIPAAAAINPTDLATVAGIAGNVTTVAGVSADVTAVAGIAADVTTVAANVIDITNFADVYQGPKTANPTLRNDGSALQAGDLYFNTVAGEMRVYDGAAWDAAYLPANAYVQKSGDTMTGPLIVNDYIESTSSITAAATPDADPDNSIMLDLVETGASGDPRRLNIALLPGAGASAREVFYRGMSASFAYGADSYHRWLTAGTERMRVDASGNVGIGTSSPDANVKLQVQGPGTFRVKHASAGSYFEVVPDSTPGLFLDSSHFSQFRVNGASSLISAMRIDSAGNVGIGTSSPATKLDVAGPASVTSFTGTTRLGATVRGSSSTNDYSGIDIIGGNLTTPVARIAALTTGGGSTLSFGTSNSYGSGITNTAMTIDSSGNLLVGFSGSTTARLFVEQAISDYIARFQNPQASGVIYGPLIRFTGQAPNNTSSEFLSCLDTTDYRMVVRSNGGIANYSGNNVNLSDRREKTNLAPAGDYLSKICAIPVQTFNYIDQNHEEDPGLTLGVVAQDVQAVAPELVMESNWGTEDNPKMRLSVYQTDLQYALMKCIQEQQAIIESLKTRIEALEGTQP